MAARVVLGHGYSCHVCLLRPKSRGALTLASADPLAPPRIDPDLLGDPDDLRRLVLGFRAMRRILEQPALAGHRGRELAASAAARDDAGVARYIRGHADTIYHPVGTCRMGRGPLDVVDAELRVHGIEGLRVVHSAERTQYYVTPEMSYEEVRFWQQSPTKSCPLVWTHRSGRKSLLLGATCDYVEGMAIEESRALLAKLRDWATQPQFVYRHEWAPGDLLIWCNTGTMHRALPYALDSGRLMHRVVLAGEEPLH